MLPSEVAELVVAFGAGAAVLYGLVRARSDWFTGNAVRVQGEREEVHEVIAIKDELIDALKASNEEQGGQIARLIEREEAWRDERSDYKRRLATLEEGYQTVLRAVTNAGICASAPNCPNYVPPSKIVS